MLPSFFPSHHEGVIAYIANYGYVIVLGTWQEQILQ